MRFRFLIVLFGAFAISGCTIDFAPPEFLEPPILRPNPNRAAPLVAILDVSTDEPSRVCVVARSDAGERRIEFDDYATDHSLTILGLVAGLEHSLDVTVTDLAGTGRPWEDSLVFDAPPLPDDFPPIRLAVSRPEEMEPGATLFAVNKSYAAADPGVGWIVALDEGGRVIWFLKTTHPVGDIRRLRNGNLLYQSGPGSGADATEVTFSGEVVRRWTASRRFDAETEASVPVDADMFHHEIFEMENGNLLTLSMEMRRFEDYPASETLRDVRSAYANLVGDVVVEFEPGGEVVRRFSLLDILDPYRIGYDSLGEGLNARFPDADNGTRDWSHANALVHQPVDDSYIVTVRHQDAVVKIDRMTGGLIWILGTHDGWSESLRPFLLNPVGEFAWPFHPHAATVTPSGTILLFDNGNNRSRPFDPKVAARDNYSRAVEYAVDPGDMAVAEVWQYSGPETDRFFSPIVGDADPLPETGNVLITAGARAFDANGVPTDTLAGAVIWATITEVTHNEPVERVFEVIVGDPESPAPGWIVYRAERLTGLSP